jgi:hypothetical protein
MSFLGFGRRGDPGLERQRQAIAHVSAEFRALEHQLEGLPELKASFAAVWDDVPQIDDLAAKLPLMREQLQILQNRADQAKAELPKFDEPITWLAQQIGYSQGMLEKLAVALVTKQGLAASRERG